MVRIEIKKVANGQMMLGIEAKKEAPDEVLTCAARGFVGVARHLLGPMATNPQFAEEISRGIKEMLLALDKVTPGIASDETLLYGVEVKFYSNKVVVNSDFETSVTGLRAIGDGASVTRGLQQASANGISVARSILKKLESQKKE